MDKAKDIAKYLYFTIACFCLACYVAFLRAYGTDGIIYLVLGFIFAFAGILKQELRIQLRSILLRIHVRIVDFIAWVLTHNRSHTVIGKFVRAFWGGLVSICVIYLLFHIAVIFNHEIALRNITKLMHEIDEDSGSSIRNAERLAKISNYMSYPTLGITGRYNWERYQLKLKDDYESKITFADAYLKARSDQTGARGILDKCYFFMAFCSILMKTPLTETGLQHFDFLVFLDSQRPPCLGGFSSRYDFDEYNSEVNNWFSNPKFNDKPSQALKSWASLASIGDITNICSEDSEMQILRDSLSKESKDAELMGTYVGPIVLNSLFGLDTYIAGATLDCTSRGAEEKLNFCQNTLDKILDTSSRLSAIYRPFSPSGNSLEVNLIKLEYFSMRNILSGGVLDVDLYFCDRDAKKGTMQNLDAFQAYCTEAKMDNFESKWAGLELDSANSSLVSLQTIYDRSVQRNAILWQQFKETLYFTKTGTIQFPFAS